MIRNLIFVAAAMVVMVMPARATESARAAAPAHQGATTFIHADHLMIEEASECTTCHLAEADSIKPDSKVCLECHEQKFVDQIAFPGLKTHGPTWALDHRQAAKAKAIDCEECHEQKFCVECHKVGPADTMGEFTNNMINVHRSDFHVSHPIAARTNPQLCASCHETKFCQDCHDNFKRTDLAGPSHRRSWSESQTLGGVNHEAILRALGTDSCRLCHSNSIVSQQDWSRDHGREARKDLMTCQACHPDGDVCIKCHSALTGLMENPHPSDWGSNKDRLRKASKGRTCRKCHGGRY